MSDTLTAMQGNEGQRSVKRGDRQTRFLAQSVILEEAGSSGLVRLAMITICFVVVAFLVWAAFTSVDEIAVTSGEVVPSGSVQVIQHLEGGIVQEVLVSGGDLVDEGQILIRLNPAAALGELDQARARFAGLMLQAERLRALGTGREPDFTIAGPGFEGIAEDQQQIYESALSAGDNRRDTLVQQVAQRRSELASFEEEEQTLAQNLEILEEQLVMREQLFRKGLSSKVVYLDIQREVNQARGDLSKLQSNRQQTQQSLEEARSRLAELDTDLREQALTEMGQVTQEMAQVRESLLRLEDRVRRLNIRAPVRGIVKGLQVKTVGGVISPGGAVMEIVPMDQGMIVETKITTRDIGHVRVGHPVSVKVTTYDFARYGGITGELREISASTFIDEESGEPYYQGKVSLDRGYVGYDPERNRVLPGMTVQADINTGEKTLLEYLLKPVVSSVSQSFRER